MPQPCMAYHFWCAYDSSDTRITLAEYFPSGRQSMSGTYKQHTEALHWYGLWLDPRLTLMGGFLHYQAARVCVIKCLYTQ